MSTSPTKDELAQSVQPDSSQINTDDLVSGPITVTITGVRRGNKEQPIQIDLLGYDRVFRPCKTMRRILIAAFTDDPKEWVGQQMTLYCDPTVTWAGVKVGGIRISHLSGLKEPRTFIITQGRGRRIETTIYPIASLSPEDAKYVQQVKADIEGCETMEMLKAAGFVLKTKSQAVRDALRPVYEKRRKELEPTE